MSLLAIGRGWREDAAAGEVSYQDTVAEALRQGFEGPQTFYWPGGGAVWFATPGNPRGSGSCARAGRRFAAYVGTVQWRGVTGATLLEDLIGRGLGPADLPLDEFFGAFAMLLALESGVWLFSDTLGIQKLYQTADGRLTSTSMMLCRATLPRPRANRLRAQEYVLLGGTHGLETPVEGVRIVDPTVTQELRSGTVRVVHAPAALRAPCAFCDRRDAVQAVAALVASELGQCVQAFGRDVGMALSGGFDSRLILAALDHLGVAPTLYVYGSSGDDDVRAATAVAARLQMPIEAIDKGLLDAGSPPLTAEALRSNLAFFDGLPADGAFDAGSDQRTRLQQVAGGRLNLNGGGGEVLRNFFYLRDRPYRASELVAAFYSNWRPEVFARPDERQALLDTLRDGILWSLGLTGGDREPLSRGDVELVYSLFRLRFWMGRNNSVAARYGAFLTPFADARLARLAAALPMSWKEHGRLEAEVIAALSTRVAAGPNGYGFDFSRGPSALHRARLATTLFRPLAVRSRSATLRRLLGRSSPAVTPAKWQNVVDSLPPQDWLDRRHLTDADQIARLFTLQAFLSPEHCGVVAIR